MYDLYAWLLFMGVKLIPVTDTRSCLRSGMPNEMFVDNGSCAVLVKMCV